MEVVKQAEHGDVFYSTWLVLACLKGGKPCPVWDVSDAWLLMSAEQGCEGLEEVIPACGVGMDNVQMVGTCTRNKKYIHNLLQKK